MAFWPLNQSLKSIVGSAAIGRCCLQGLPSCHRPFPQKACLRRELAANAKAAKDLELPSNSRLHSTPCEESTSEPSEILRATGEWSRKISRRLLCMATRAASNCVHV